MEDIVTDMSEVWGEMPQTHMFKCPLGHVSTSPLKPFDKTCTDMLCRMTARAPTGSLLVTDEILFHHGNYARCCARSKRVYRYTWKIKVRVET